MHNPSPRAPRPSRRTAFATASWIAQSAAILALNGGFAAGAAAAEPFLLTAYVNYPGGPELAAGQYAAALTKIAPQRPAAALDTAAQTNRCVAFIAMGELHKARQACDRAAIAADRSTAHATGVVSMSRIVEDEQLAIAHANRAIAHCLSKQVVSCAEDLAQAYALFPAGGFVTRNLGVFQRSHGAAPGVEIAARRIGDCEACAADARAPGPDGTGLNACP